IALDERLAERTGLRPGEKAAVITRDGAREYTVSALVTGPGAAETVFLADTDAATASGRPGTADAIGILTTPGTSVDTVQRAVEQAVGDRPVSVLSGDERGRAEDPGIVPDGSKLITLASVFGGLSAMVTVFVVSSTLSLSIQQRQREMALLRAIGTTPGQLRRLIVGETLLISIIATALATLPGPLLGRWLLDAFASADVVSEGIAYRAAWVPLVIGAATGLISAVGAAFIAARRPALTRPTEALAEAAVEKGRLSRVRVVFALLCLGGATALALVTAHMDGPTAGSTATPAAMLWTAGFGLLGPTLSTAVVAVVRRPLCTFTGLAGQLAAANAKARATRLAGAVMPVMLATGLASALIYLQTTQSTGSERAFEESLRADLTVASAVGGLPLEMVATVRSQPGVAAASARINSLGYIERRDAGENPEEADPIEVPLLGVTHEGLEKTTGYHAASGSLDRLSGETVALPGAFARESGYELGDSVPMRLGDGSRVRLELVATVDGRRGYETALLPAALMAPHTYQGLVPQIMVRATEDTSVSELRQTLSKLSAQQPGLMVADRTDLADLHAKGDETQASMSYLVLAVVVGYSTIALVNTQVMATTERRREFLLQRLIGATRRQVMRMMTVEAVLVALAGITLGAVVALLTLIPLSISVLGSPMPEGSPLIFTAVVLSAFGLTLLTTLVSAGLVLRNRPAGVAGTRD
ncbi:ABC transporter permease, partial [Streptomyces sp. NPDC057638]|uniref:ABC transporter permease n=1 Tax=Streptomyces sp. NPDC057638 TaxID=3346190 RepID=UPI0036B1C769